MLDTSSLKGKTAVVTGSTSGIGLGIAKAFAAEGCNIVINGMGEKAAIDAELADLQKTYSVKAVYSDADMSKADQIRGMVKLAVDTFGSVDILVNNAGIQHTAPVHEFPKDKWDAIIAINLSAIFHACKAALPHMQKKGFGRIINTDSVHGLVGSTNKAAYVAAKHGLAGLTKVIALENAEANITCNSICPGWVHTPLVQKQIDDKAKAEGITPEKAQAAMLGEKQPSRRFVTTEQIGAIAVFLCTDAASGMTGDMIPVDGGWTAQ